jgi:hypothetical protein
MIAQECSSVPEQAASAWLLPRLSRRTELAEALSRLLAQGKSHTECAGE